MKEDKTDMAFIAMYGFAPGGTGFTKSRGIETAIVNHIIVNLRAVLKEVQTYLQEAIAKVVPDVDLKSLRGQVHGLELDEIKAIQTLREAEQLAEKSGYVVDCGAR